MRPIYWVLIVFIVCVSITWKEKNRFFRWKSSKLPFSLRNRQISIVPIEIHEIVLVLRLPCTIRTFFQRNLRFIEKVDRFTMSFFMNSRFFWFSSKIFRRQFCNFRLNSSNLSDSCRFSEKDSFYVSALFLSTVNLLCQLAFITFSPI